MSIILPALPYAMDALVPHISAETLEYHYGKHHQTYVTKLNELIVGTHYATQDLETIIKNSDGAVFNNAAQIWNHTFYWNSLTPNSGSNPAGDLSVVITDSFGSVNNFKQEFTTAALTLFGAGWVWLVKDAQGKLSIEKTTNAATPLTGDKTAVLTCDVWEHAYYIDYRNSRPNYINAFWQLVNWEFAALNYKS